MRNKAEYMQFAIKRDLIADIPRFLESLRASQECVHRGAESKLARTMRFAPSEEAGFLFLEAFVGTRALLTFQQTAKKRPFFLRAVRSIWRFMSLYSVDVRVTFFTDTVSRAHALKHAVPDMVEKLDVGAIPAGVGVILVGEPRFYFCVYEAAQCKSSDEGSAEGPTRFFAHAVALTSAPEEVQGMLHRYLAENGARLLCVDELDHVAPVEFVPNLSGIGFEWETPRIIYSSGRAFYSDDQE